MPLTALIARQVNSPRKIFSLSALFGLTICALFVAVTLLIIWQRITDQHDRFARAAQASAEARLDGLTHALAPLRNQTQAHCADVSNELTRRAAFTGSVRAILLVNQHNSFCSSATGDMQLDISRISPTTRLENDKDIRLMSGTPLAPGQPALVLWLKDPRFAASGVLITMNITLPPALLLAAREHEVTGMAIVAGDKAFTTASSGIVATRALTEPPVRSLPVNGYPLRILLYGSPLPTNYLNMTLLAGLVLGLCSALACFMLLTLKAQQGKEILMGIKRGEFHVEYQPVVEASTGKTVALEALMRWTHHTQGRIPPDAFISYAELQNLMAPLTRHLFELVARDAHALMHVTPVGTRMALNISPAHLVDNDFRQDVLNWLAAMPANHFDYVFELTERTMVSEKNAAQEFRWLQQQGIRIAIDDFGTGHSALIYLEKFNFDFLKIDRGFVQSIGLETVTSPVLDTVLTLAERLDLNTVAEGVETWEQAGWLVEHGVTYLQGYLFSRPCTVSHLIDYFHRENQPAV
ncbi:cyclic di-GMP phosphodiesterase [Erwinia oleae]|uniref:cyclic di-GMP phosphodiesterase n=1 Tax=Erwinia oleae TaxID=796334 RepID=UPI0005586EF7|nr:cyclic di-GMP phosphodiesterase [Erwinia oleae]